MKYFAEMGPGSELSIKINSTYPQRWARKGAPHQKITQLILDVFTELLCLGIVGSPAIILS